MNAALVERLHAWAKYLRGGGSSGRSLVASIYTYKLDDAGASKSGRPLTARGKPTASSPIRPTPSSPRDECTESAVCELRAKRPELGLVIVAEFLGWVPAVQHGQFGWHTVAYDPVKGATGHQAELGARLGISARTYRARLELGLTWLEAYFEASENRAA